MSSTRPSRAAPLSVRLSREQRVRLGEDAGGRSINSYVIWMLFHSDQPPPRSRRNLRGGLIAVLTALLAKLGQSRIANNLNELVKLARSGSLVLTPDIEAEIHQMAADIDAMRTMLVAALNLREDAS